MTRRDQLSARLPRSSVKRQARAAIIGATREMIAATEEVRAASGQSDVRRLLKRKTDLQQLSLTIPLTPPSVNHYVKHSRGRHYRTKDADDFMLLVKQAVKGREIRAKAYGVSIGIYLGPKQRGDIDNFAKVVLDSLVSSGAIDSDSRVEHLAMEKYRTSIASTTFIEVRAL